MNEGKDFFKRLKDFLISLGAKEEEGTVFYENKDASVEIAEKGQFYNYEIFAYRKGRGFATASIESMLDDDDGEYFFLWNVLMALGINRKVFFN